MKIEITFCCLIANEAELVRYSVGLMSSSLIASWKPSTVKCS